MWWVTVLSITSIVMSWAQKSLEDGAIDAQEAAELVTIICRKLDVKAEIKLPSLAEEE